MGEGRWVEHKPAHKTTDVDQYQHQNISNTYKLDQISRFGWSNEARREV